MAQGKRVSISPEQIRAIRRTEARSSAVAFIAFFIMGLSVLLSLDTASGGLTPFAWFVIPVGIVAGVAIFVFGRRWARTP